MSKTAVITGSTGGIGTALADQLAAAGWRLILVNRNPKKAAEQKDALSGRHSGGQIDLIQADLMDTNEIKRAASEILTRVPSIDVIYNNSGVLTAQRNISAQGHESNYAINTLAPYVMIESLRPALVRMEGAAPAMVINTTSSAQSSAKTLNVEELSNPDTIGGLNGAYATTKLALTTMGAALAHGLQQDGILLRSVCPGPVNTPMTKTSDAMPAILRLFVPLLFKSPEKQAAKMIYAAQAGAYGGRTGIYLTNGKEKPLPKLAADPTVQAVLVKKLATDAAAPAPA